MAALPPARTWPPLAAATPSRSDRHWAGAGAGIALPAEAGKVIPRPQRWEEKRETGGVLLAATVTGHCWVQDPSSGTMSGTSLDFGVFSTIKI